MVATQTSALSALLELRRGWHYKTRANAKAHYIGPCPFNDHGNDDSKSAFSLDETGQLFKCWKCGIGGAGPKQMREKLGNIPIAPIERKVSHGHKEQKKQKARIYPNGCTLENLAQIKGLDVSGLALHGWEDTTYKIGNARIPAIRISYWDQQWDNPIIRYRVGTTGDKYRWAKGAQITPYGLWRLGEARAKGYIVIVEGETDSAALWQYGFSALGLPGAGTWKGEWSHYLSGIANVYLWQEPDKAGQALADKLTEWIPDIKIITAPGNAKDPCELAQLSPDTFKATMQALMDNAIMPERAEIAPQLTHSPETEGSHTESHPVLDSQQINFDTGEILRGSAHQDHDEKVLPWWISLDCQETHRNRRKNAAKEGRPDSLIGEVMAHQDLIRHQSKPNAEFCTSKVTGTKLCINTENPYLFIDHEDLLELVGLVDGEKDSDGNDRPTYKRLVECGLRCRYDCIEHRTKKSGIHSCKLNFDPNCRSHMAKQLSLSKLPDLEGDASYTEIWIHSEYARGDTVEWQTKLVELMDLWEKSIASLSRSKRYKGNVYFRSFATYYEGTTAKIHWKAMVYEASKGDSDYAARYLAEKMAGTIECQRRYQSGETAVTQLVADAFSHLVGIDTRLPIQERTDIFAAHYFATKGRHIFQGLGDLYKLLEELPKPGPLVCDECGRTLKQILEPREQKPDPGYNSPTSPNYIYKDTT